MLSRILFVIAALVAGVQLSACQRSQAARPTKVSEICDFKKSMPRQLCDCMMTEAERELPPEVQDLLVLAMVRPVEVYKQTDAGKITGDMQARLDQFLEPTARMCKKRVAMK